MKRIFSLLFVVCISALAFADSYEVYVAGVQVTDANKDNITGDNISGKVSYNPATKTILFHNGTKVDVPAGSRFYCFDAKDNVTVQIEGEVLWDQHSSGYANTIFRDNYNYVVEGVTPDAKLTVKDYQQPAFLYYGDNTKSLTFRKLALDVSTQMYDLYSKNGGKLLLDCVNADFTTQGYSPVTGFGSVEFKRCELVTPWNATFDAGKKVFVADGENVVDYIKVEVADYHLNVGGVAVTGKNCDDVMGDGSVVYNPEEKVLTLKNANIESPNGITFDITTSNTIKIEGTNKIHATQGDGFYTTWIGDNSSDRTLTFTSAGNGTLDIVSDKSKGMEFFQVLHKFDHCNINATGKDYGIYGGKSYVFVATTSTMHVKGGTSALYFENASMTDCHISDPVGAVLDANQCVYLLNGQPVKDITIIPGKFDSFPITVMGVVVNTDNCDDILGDGKVSYDQATRTLTLADGTVLENDQPRNIIEADCELTIKCLGDATISTTYTSFAPLAFLNNHHVTLTGGHMKVVNNQQPCIFFGGDGDYTFTIKDMEFEGSTQMDVIWSKFHGNLLIKNAKCSFKTQNYVPIDGFATANLIDCYVSNPKGAVYDSQQRAFVLNGEKIYNLLEIEPGTDGIEAVTFDSNAPRYNLQGVRVGNDYRGIVIQNGKRIMVK